MSRLLLIQSFLNLEVAWPCILSCMSSYFGDLEPLPIELADLECLKNRRLHFFAVDPILFKLTSFKDMQKIFREFELRKDPTTYCVVCCP